MNRLSSSLIPAARWFPAPWRQALCVFAGALLATGCGDSGGSSTPAPTKVTKANKKPGRKTQTKGDNLQFYAKIENFVTDPEEAKQIRHRFEPMDFEPDITGDENRDPFRSYVIRQPGVTRQQNAKQNNQPEEGPKKEACSHKNQVAANYSLRDLRLVGIVLRGTRAYALFRDSASYGHIVRKGDCLGQEKARVTAIRTGFVSLEVAADAPTGNSPIRPPQERAIQLYPEELTVEEPAEPESAP